MLRINAKSILSNLSAFAVFCAVVSIYSFVVRTLILTEAYDDQPVKASCFSDGKPYIDDSVEKWMDQNGYIEPDYYEAIYSGSLSCGDMLGWTQYYRPPNDVLAIIADTPGLAATLLLAALAASRTAKLMRKWLY